MRAFASPRAGCRLGSRNQYNTLTGVIDGNTVYGVTEEFGRKLRSGIGGALRMNPVFAEYGLKDLLPLKLDIPDEGCTRPNKSMYCFEAGEWIDANDFWIQINKNVSFNFDLQVKFG